MTYFINHKEQQARQERLDALFLADRRDAKDHPFHNLYTGLVNITPPKESANDHY